MRGNGQPVTDRGGPPENIGAVVERFLDSHGHRARVALAAVVDDWPRIAGPQIARVTVARAVAADGTLIVGVATNAWMSELAMHEAEFVARLNEGFSPPRVRRIRWLLAARESRP